MMRLHGKIIAALLATVCAFPSLILATEKTPAGGYVFGGQVLGYDGELLPMPVCALVLINGQNQFSCDGTGRYDMQVPLDSDGMITIQAFAAGFAPFRETVTPEQAFEYSIEMPRAEQDKELEVYGATTLSDPRGRTRLQGKIEFRGKPLCALVLANGQSQFTCREPMGMFELEAPPDLNEFQESIITLQVFAAGFQPYRITVGADPDTDGDRIPDREDLDDDNDNLPDDEDDCPLVPYPGECGEGKEITDTVVVDGREWAQVSLFDGVTWEQADNVCGTYRPNSFGQVYLHRCVGTLNGYDVTGWRWASATDTTELFNHYLGEELLDGLLRRGGDPEFFEPDPAMDAVNEYENREARVLVDSNNMAVDGWQWTSSRSSGGQITLELEGMTNSAVVDWYGIPGPISSRFRYESSGQCSGCWREIFTAVDEHLNASDRAGGVWLYR